jgi:hypothetical protein
MTGSTGTGVWRDSFGVALQALFFSCNKDFFLPSAVFLFAGVLGPSAACSPSLASLSVHRSHQRPSRCTISYINAASYSASSLSLA